jgi:hypothetical protein
MTGLVLLDGAICGIASETLSTGCRLGCGKLAQRAQKTVGRNRLTNSSFLQLFYPK